MTTNDHVGQARMTRTSRSPEALAGQLQAWLAGRLPAGADPVIVDLESGGATGMSSETVLFTVALTEATERRTARLVARVAPHPADVPVFPDYDMQRQFATIRLVGERTAVPVPPLRWLELDPAPLGAPFFVMDRVDGRVPPDVLPYNFGDSWLFALGPDDRRRLQDASVDVLAALHAVPASPDTAFLEYDAPGVSALARHLAHTAAWYDFVAADGMRSPLAERALAWLHEHLPSDDAPAVLCWGDARIGNVLYDDLSPAAVLDWEMACVGPRELDVAWMVYAHRCFEDMAQQFGFAGMPDFLRADDVAARYEAATGHAPRHLGWHVTYAAAQWAITFLRTGQRSVRFGDRPMPDDVDDLVLNRPRLEQLLARAPYADPPWI